MVKQGFDESDRLRFLVAEARKALEKVGLVHACSRWVQAAAAREAQAEADLH